MDFPVSAHWLVQNTGMPLRTAQGLVESVSCGKIGRTHFARKEDLWNAIERKLKHEGNSSDPAQVGGMEGEGLDIEEAAELLWGHKGGSRKKGKPGTKGENVIHLGQHVPELRDGGLHADAR